MTVLVVIEADGDAIATSSLAAIAFARQMSDGVDVAVVQPGDGVPDALAKQGVTTLHTLDHRLLDGYSPEAWGDGLAQLVGKLRPAGVVAAATERGNELMAQVAARAGLPLATGCVAVELGDAWRLTRIRAGGVLLEDAELHAPVKLVTVQPAAAEPGEVGAPGAVTVSPFVPALGDDLQRSRIVERTTRSEGLSLATAPVVVSGGRGVGSAEGFAPLEELAELVGGVVGCSRVATNNGWRSHRDQVGLTGTKIAPELYIACGISGATQHWVGCMDAKQILAINTDAEAPMVTRATYAVIGDVHDVLRAVIEEIHARKRG